MSEAAVSKVITTIPATLNRFTATPIRAGTTVSAMETLSSATICFRFRVKSIVPAKR